MSRLLQTRAVVKARSHNILSVSLCTLLRGLIQVPKFPSRECNIIIRGGVRLWWEPKIVLTAARYNSIRREVNRLASARVPCPFMSRGSRGSQACYNG